MVDPELLGRLLEGVVHGELPHLLLELVETLLASLLVPGDDGEVVLGAVRLAGLQVWSLVGMLARVITFSRSLPSGLALAPSNLADNISSQLTLLQLTVPTVTLAHCHSDESHLSDPLALKSAGKESRTNSSRLLSLDDV